MILDYPHIRHSRVCPFCRGPKTNDLIACWPCFRAEGLRNGETPAQRGTLLRQEAILMIGEPRELVRRRNR